MIDERAAVLKRLGTVFRRVALSEGIMYLTEKQLIALMESKLISERPPRERLTAALR